MSQDTLIYAAGNPDLYPLEYYDPETGDYRGAVPELLREFAREHGYTLRYYQPGQEDRREALAENRQVDLISGGWEDYFPHTEGEAIPLLQAEIDGQLLTVRLFVSDVAPDGLRSDLQSFLSQVTQAQWAGEILRASETGLPEHPALFPLTLGLGIAACLLLVICLLLFSRLRRRVRRPEPPSPRERYQDLLTEQELEGAYSSAVNQYNRALYHILCFHFDLGHIERLLGQEGLLAFHRYAADTLKQRSAPGDILALAANGDLLVLKSSETTAQVELWSQAAVEVFRAFSLEGIPLRVSDAAVGIYSLKDSREEPFSSVLFYARQCAQEACRSELDSKICGGAGCRTCAEERQLLAQFDRGLAQQEFQLFLQFFVNANTHQIIGGEALTRWLHPGKGLLSPDRFIPLLEREGQIHRLDFRCLEQVCAFLTELEQMNLGDFFISCNFSRKTISSPRFFPAFQAVMERYSFPRRLLILEITESEQIQQKEEAQLIQNIVAVRNMGAKVMLDDFGMGFSSFRDLQEYPMDGLKLDKSLVDNMDTERGRIILEGLIETGHQLGLTVLAEGVENDQQVKALRQLHCDVFQGFRFAFPIPAAEAKQKLLDRH